MLYEFTTFTISMGWIHEKSQENLENLRLGKTEGKIFAILIEFMKVEHCFFFIFSSIETDSR